MDGGAQCCPLFVGIIFVMRVRIIYETFFQLHFLMKPQWSICASLSCKLFLRLTTCKVLPLGPCPAAATTPGCTSRDTLRRLSMPSVAQAASRASLRPFLRRSKGNMKTLKFLYIYYVVFIIGAAASLRCFSYAIKQLFLTPRPRLHSLPVVPTLSARGGGGQK